MDTTTLLTRPTINPGIRMYEDDELFDAYMTLKHRSKKDQRKQRTDERTERVLSQVTAEITSRGYDTAWVEQYAA